MKRRQGVRTKDSHQDHRLGRTSLWPGTLGLLGNKSSDAGGARPALADELCSASCIQASTAAHLHQGLFPTPVLAPSHVHGM